MNCYIPYNYENYINITELETIGDLIAREGVIDSYVYFLWNKQWILCHITEDDIHLDTILSHPKIAEELQAYFLESAFDRVKEYHLYVHDDSVPDEWEVDDWFWEEGTTFYKTRNGWTRTEPKHEKNVTCYYCYYEKELPDELQFNYWPEGCEEDGKYPYMFSRIDEDAKDE